MPSNDEDGNSLTAKTGPPLLSQGIQELAELSARMDSRIQSSRLAILAPDLGSIGLGRMGQAYREMAPDSNKEAKAFKTLADARAWLEK